MNIGDFFRIRKSDRQIVTLLLLLALAGIMSLFLTGHELTPDDSVAEDTLSRQLHHSFPQGNTGANDEQADLSSVERFCFDPNTADSSQLSRLGLEPWLVRNIYKYRARGGIFRTKEDFARIHGLTVGQYRSLEPYIRIGRDYQPAATLFTQKETAPVDTLRRMHKISAGETINLATADTTQLKRVPGIGSYYASRIAQYGQRLGGYVSVDQLDEIDELPPGLKQHFIIDSAAPRRLNLNTLSVNELKRHPYINYYQARAIVDYRRLHGLLHSLDDLQLLRDFPAEVRSRLEPYVCF